MKKIIALGLLFVGVTVSGFASANSLGSCMVDSLTGKERKELAKWIYFAMASHPYIQEFANVTKDDLKKTDQYIGGLVTRLLTSDCPKELAAVSQADPMAVEKAFEVVGQVAMQELMANEKVMRTISSYATYADLEKIGSVAAGR